MISHENKSIFVHIPKTGGTSIEMALKRHSFKTAYNSYLDGKKVTRGWDKKYDEVELIRGNSEVWVHKHRPVNLIKPKYSNYYTFAFVRNPWDLMVSSYEWWVQKTEDASEIRDKTGKMLKQKGFDYYVKSKFGKCINECFHDQEGQHKWITDENNNITVDFVGRFENLQEDYNKICKNLGIKLHKLPHALKAKRKSYVDYYTKETKEIVEQIYRRDIEKFGYNFEGSVTGLRIHRNVHNTNSTENKKNNSKEISLISKALDCNTLICINSCEKDRKHLKVLKKSDFYNKILNDDNIKVIEYYRGSKKIHFDGRELHLPGVERYDELHSKSFQMIKFCAKYFDFKNLVKLDGNFMSYESVGERTRKKICGIDRVEKTIYKKPNLEYFGSNGRVFYSKDFHAWMKSKGMTTDMEDPDWLNQEVWYFCGKCYRINYRVAQFILENPISEQIKKSQDMVNSNGMKPYSVEDVMIGRMYEEYLKQ